MALARLAEVQSVTALGPDSRLLDLRMREEPLGFIGGQYVIIDSGLTLPNGKAAKRAYSIVTSDVDQTRFQIAVLRIPGGLASGFLHQAYAGMELKLSGPWGKLYPSGPTSGRTLVLATDTGITAALGLLASQRFAPLLPRTTFVWLRTAPSYFLTDDVALSRLPLSLGRADIRPLPPIDHPERVPWVRALLRELLLREQRAPLAQAFIAGDGAVNYALLDDLIDAGVPATRDSVESFFNMPRKSAA